MQRQRWTGSQHIEKGQLIHLGSRPGSTPKQQLMENFGHAVLRPDSLDQLTTTQVVSDSQTSLRQSSQKGDVARLSLKPVTQTSLSRLRTTQRLEDSHRPKAAQS